MAERFDRQAETVKDPAQMVDVNAHLDALQMIRRDRQRAGRQ
jgi:hypothetical protein